MTEKREQMIGTTCELLEAQGYYATGLREILARSGAPRGSLYYYFPGGKSELAAEAVERTGEVFAQRIERHLPMGEDLSSSLQGFVERIAEGVERSDFRTGGPLATVAMETATSDRVINESCREAYRRLQAAFEARFLEADLDVNAGELAVLVTSAIEGGIILSRTHHSGDPLRTVGSLLGELIDSVTLGGSRTGDD
jgi:TetR/AcrR family transcriptional repressor of lmrAB and yxaGH operons